MEKQFSYELGAALGSETAFGLIVLQADETLEHDMRRLLPNQSAALYTSRVPSGTEVTTETLGEMAGEPTGAALFFRHLYVLMLWGMDAHLQPRSLGQTELRV